MIAAVFREAGVIAAEELPAPSAEATDVVVAVRACGICGSDMHAYEHGLYVQPGQVMGHEFAGDVVAVGDSVSDISVGDRVAVMPYAACGACAACRAGRPHLCAAFMTASIAYGLPGAFAELVRVPDARLGANVHRLGDATSYEAAALAEPLAVACHAVRLADPKPDEHAMVVGQGPIGLLVVQALRAHGVGAVTAVDVSEHRLRTASRVGATETVLAVGQRLSDASGCDVDLVFECSGVPHLVDQALRAVSPGGRVVAVAVYGGRVEINPSLVVQRELRLQGSFAATGEDFAFAVQLIEGGAILHRELISHRFALADIDRAFEAQADRAHAVKVMVGDACPDGNDEGQGR